MGTTAATAVKRIGERINYRSKRLRKKTKRPRVLKTFTKQQIQQMAEEKSLLRLDLDNTFSFKWVVCLLTFNNSQSLKTTQQWQAMVEHWKNVYKVLSTARVGNLWKLENIKQTFIKYKTQKKAVTTRAQRPVKKIIKNIFFTQLDVIKSTQPQTKNYNFFSHHLAESVESGSKWGWINK